MPDVLPTVLAGPAQSALAALASTLCHMSADTAWVTVPIVALSPTPAESDSNNAACGIVHAVGNCLPQDWSRLSTSHGCLYEPQELMFWRFRQERSPVRTIGHSLYRLLLAAQQCLQQHPLVQESIALIQLGSLVASLSWSANASKAVLEPINAKSIHHVLVRCSAVWTVCGRPNNSAP